MNSWNRHPQRSTMWIVGTLASVLLLAAIVIAVTLSSGSPQIPTGARVRVHSLEAVPNYGSLGAVGCTDTGKCLIYGLGSPTLTALWNDRGAWFNSTSVSVGTT